MFRSILVITGRLVRAPIMAVIVIYRYAISPLFPSRCRFYPTCSEYAHGALLRFSLPYALWLIIKRLLKCHPFCRGGLDPLPQKTDDNPHKST